MGFQYLTALEWMPVVHVIDAAQPFIDCMQNRSRRVIAVQKMYETIVRKMTARRAVDWPLCTVKAGKAQYDSIGVSEGYLFCLEQLGGPR